MLISTKHDQHQPVVGVGVPLVGHELLILIMFCRDEHAAELVDAICKAAHTGNRGDGMVAVTELAELVRIRTGERGDAAA